MHQLLRHFSPMNDDGAPKGPHGTLKSIIDQPIFLGLRWSVSFSCIGRQGRDTRSSVLAGVKNIPPVLKLLCRACREGALTSGFPMLQDLAFDAISSFSLRSKMSMYKGGDSTKEVFLNAVNYPFNSFFGGLQNSFPCGALLLCLNLLTTWGGRTCTKERVSIQGGVGRG